MKHPTTEEIILFAAGRADELLLEHVYQHIADCEACNERYQVATEIRSNFDANWDEFLLEATHRLQASRPSLAPSTTSPVSLVIRGLMDAAERVSSCCQEIVEASSQWSATLVPSYGGVGSPEATPALAQHLRNASSALQRDELEKATQELRSAAAEDAKAAGTSRLDLQVEDRLAGSVYAQAQQRSVHVMVISEFLDGTPTDVGLTVQDADETRWLPLEIVEGAAYLMAEFADVPDGIFHVKFRQRP